MADAILYPKELGDVFDRAKDRCFGRICAGEEGAIAFLVLMDMEGELSDQRIAIEKTEGYFDPLTNVFSEEQRSLIQPGAGQQGFCRHTAGQHFLVGADQYQGVNRA